jgi:hypothetical protein
MLIDQLLGDSILAKAGYLTADLRGRLAKAPKFVLRRDFAMAADALSGSLDDLNKALPFCRLPYPECWIEVAQGDRRSFAESPIALETDSPIKRVAFCSRNSIVRGLSRRICSGRFRRRSACLGYRCRPIRRR